MTRDSFITAAADAEYEFTEKRSRFIGYIRNVTSAEEADAFINEIKSKHYDARHNCSAYILRDGREKYSDDGEPTGTAGKPISDCIKKSGICDVCVVVTRYFGGILLGGGGLYRAYTATASGVIEEAPKREYKQYIATAINCGFSDAELIKKLLSKYSTNDIRLEYTDFVKIELLLAENERNLFENELTERFAGKIKPNFGDSTFA